LTERNYVFKPMLFKAVHITSLRVCELILTPRFTVVHKGRSAIKSIAVFALFFLSACTSLYSQWDWQQMPLPRGYNDNYYLDVQFLTSNPQLGWICGYGGATCRTTNGGATWLGSRTPVGGQLESICFVNSRVGYVSGIADQSGEGGIFRSGDGGATWTDITPYINVGGIPRRPQLWGNFFFDELNGIVVGGGCDSPQLFFKTTNGGVSWQLAQYNAPNTGMSHVKMFDPNGLCIASSSGALWRSTDGGISWNLFTRTGNSYWQENLSYKGSTYLLATSSEACYGNQDRIGDVRSSNDNGATWRRQSTGAAMFGTFLLDSKIGWAVGLYNTVLRTSDGGQSFRSYTCGLPDDGSWDDVWFINDTTGFIVGKGAYRTVRPVSPPVISALSSTNVCEGDSVTLTVTNRDYDFYLWSTGETTKSIRVTRSGEYRVEAGNSRRCLNRSNAINVIVNTKPKSDLTASNTNRHICFGDSLTLTTRDGYANYLWNTGEKTSAIVVKEAGMYSVTITDTNGCVTIDSIPITKGDRIVPTINSRSGYKVCEGDTVFLSAQSGFSRYEWSSGETTTDIIVTSSGKRVLRVWDSFGCPGEPTEIDVEITPNPLLIIGYKDFDRYIMDSTNAGVLHCEKIKIKNLSNETLVITEAILLRNIEFSKPLSQLPITISALGEQDFTVCYLPSLLTTQLDTVIIGDYCKRRLILQSAGKPNNYNGNAQCDIPFNSFTTSINTPGLNISGITPNPVEQGEMVRILMQSPSPIDNIEVIDVTSASISVSPIVITKATTTSQVKEFEVLLDTKQISQGVYIAIVKSAMEVKTIPFVVR
jgi:photosystem II stability/assembly factor-like uncharacterized protein